MKPLAPEDLLDIAAYERVRERKLAEIIELKKTRRIGVGPYITLLFENRETVRSQIQEMMRAERTVDERAIREELDAYNPLIPADGEISATLFIEVEDQSRVREVLDRFLGLDEPACVALRFAAAGIVPAQFEAGHSREDRISAVHLVRFALGEAERKAFRSGEGPIAIAIRHPAYKAEAEITGALRRALAGDLG